MRNAEPTSVLLRSRRIHGHHHGKRPGLRKQVQNLVHELELWTLECDSVVTKCLLVLLIIICWF